MDILKHLQIIKSYAVTDPDRAAACAVNPRFLGGAEDNFHRVDFRNSRLIPTSRVPCGSLHSRAQVLKCFGAPQEPTLTRLCRQEGGEPRLGLGSKVGMSRLSVLGDFACSRRCWLRGKDVCGSHRRSLLSEWNRRSSSDSCLCNQCGVGMWRSWSQLSQV